MATYFFRAVASDEAGGNAPDGTNGTSGTGRSSSDAALFGVRRQRAGFHSRAAGDQWHLQARLIHEAFVVEPKIAEIPAVIRRVEDNRILRETGAVEIIQHAADAVIHALHAGEVVLHVALVFPLGQFLAGEFTFRAVGIRD